MTWADLNGPVLVWLSGGGGLIVGLALWFIALTIAASWPQATRAYSAARRRGFDAWKLILGLVFLLWALWGLPDAVEFILNERHEYSRGHPD